ncbi:MAG TPA: hypothetical protein PK752_04920, partial [Accumulibacter sp.]|nr:hypothetical protein [Accumulibacter sp.]
AVPHSSAAADLQLCRKDTFYRTLNGARVGDLFMSLIHTAELHQIEPFHYLVALLRHNAAVVLDPSAWMPWNYTQALAVAESGLAVN